MASGHFFPTGKRGRMCSLEVFAMRQLHDCPSALCSKTCSVAKFVLRLTVCTVSIFLLFPRQHRSPHQSPQRLDKINESGSGSHSGWVVWLFQAVVISCHYHCEREGCNAAGFQPEVCKNSPALRWSSPHRHCKTCHFSIFVALRWWLHSFNYHTRTDSDDCFW